MNKKERTLNAIMSLTGIVAVVITLYRYIDVKTHPEVYIGDSAPWYVALLPYLVICILIIAVCLVIKLIAKKKN